MAEDNGKGISGRKKEHIEICLTDKAAFRQKDNGLGHYEFIHFAATEAVPAKIDLSTDFFGKKVNYPFIISCMTGGTTEAENINAMLSNAARELNIPLGVGSQRQALENDSHISSYKAIRQNAGDIPILGNIGAAQVCRGLTKQQLHFLVDSIKADAFVVHINPLQELVQKGGEPDFSGLARSVEKLVKEIEIPVIAKEVGAGIGKRAAKIMLEAGVSGIDVAGAGGTSWSAVEMLRNREPADNYLWEWGLPTSYCVRKVKKLKKDFDFTLIGSGGINNAVDTAKVLALGADFAASARMVLQALDRSGADGVTELIAGWFEFVRKAMFLTGSMNLSEFRKKKLKKIGDLH